ncbi:MAG TPA: amidase [Candidatus Didemnitutus sp.]|jgi:amidase/aspartyl-tRNA(Asn)/glutamyl-tRNA(Gln) amidotransferase subunit A
MDTNGTKTPVPSGYHSWRNLAPAEAARRILDGVAGLGPPLRRAAIAWLATERDLVAGFGRAWISDPQGPLSGVPYFLKDLFDAADAPTGAGSTFLSRIRPSRGDAAMVHRLRDAGAVFAGKTQLVEFASGLTGENPHFGDCPHPNFPDRLSGGSSSGSAAMVAAGVVPLAIGTDTGGSVRVPAAFCGLYGFRLTPGEPLIADAFPLSPTMDTAGWFNASATDMLSTWRALVEPGHPAATPARRLRGCYLRGAQLGAGMDQEIESACADAARALGAVSDPSATHALLESWKGSVDAYVTIGMTEAHHVHRGWLESHRSEYDPLIWERFRNAGDTSSDLIEEAHHRRHIVASGWAHYFADHDFLVLPAAPCPAPRKSDCTPALRRNILALSAPASLGGLPCLSLPVPLESGLTAGLQVVAPAANSPVFEAALAADM